MTLLDWFLWTSRSLSQLLPGGHSDSRVRQDLQQHRGARRVHQTEQQWSLSAAEHDCQSHRHLEECAGVALHRQERGGREQESSCVHQIPLWVVQLVQQLVLSIDLIYFTILTPLPAPAHCNQERKKTAIREENKFCCLLIR